MKKRLDEGLTAPQQRSARSWEATILRGAGPWRVEFWMGGWDADVLCGFRWGLLRLPSPEDAVHGRSSVGLRVTDRRP